MLEAYYIGFSMSGRSVKRSARSPIRSILTPGEQCRVVELGSTTARPTVSRRLHDSSSRTRQAEQAGSQITHQVCYAGLFF